MAIELGFRPVLAVQIWISNGGSKQGEGGQSSKDQTRQENERRRRVENERLKVRTQRVEVWRDGNEREGAVKQPRNKRAMGGEMQRGRPRGMKRSNGREVG
jgi:hypothetical protein